MKKVMLFGLIATLTVGFCLPTGVVAKEWKNVRVATEGAYPPWNATDADGKLYGFDIDVIEEVCRRMNLECEIIPQAWKGIIPGLTAGKYDLIIAGMQATAKRLKVIDFAGPYAKTPGSFATLKSSPLAGFKSAEEGVTLNDITASEQEVIDALRSLLKGKVIGVQTTTTHSNFLDTYFKDVARIQKYESQENVLLDLKAGRIDAAEASLSVWIPAMKKETGADVTLFGPAWTGDIFGLGNGVGLRKEDQDLKAIISKGLAEMKADGTIQKLALKWFGFDNSPKDDTIF
ncbi:nopaline-binding periplasmic protein [Desulfosarcina alkanivorans]|uniref:Nopaline-binding periplasmic protein n=1 Tax=Desulfosarcina alkanivorans TaxID=571177 RepID=A0A5K7YX36_9BACT|nr:transporter substrate-binding domain-containing protein [Desulfosarcina alkanivorans]BBO72523.1 nopaline-binding periplasmic protein [Desulfosarcina alkanivorans]